MWAMGRNRNKFSKRGCLIEVVYYAVSISLPFFAHDCQSVIIFEFVSTKWASKVFKRFNSHFHLVHLVLSKLPTRTLFAEDKTTFDDAWVGQELERNSNWKSWWVLSTLQWPEQLIMKDLVAIRTR